MNAHTVCAACANGIAHAPRHLYAGDLDVGLCSAIVRFAGSRLLLGPTARAMLGLLARSPGTLWTRALLGFYLEVDDRALDRAALTIRHALRDAGADPSALITDRGTGFRLLTPHPLEQEVHS